MSKKQRRDSIGSIAIQRVGMRKAFNVVTFIVEWSMVCDKLGRKDIQVEEFADWWIVSRAQAFRRQAAFRETFPEFLTPMALLEAAHPGVFGKGKDEAAAVAELFATPMVFA